MGEAIAQLAAEEPDLWRRSELVITTKLFFGTRNGVNESGLSRKHVVEGMAASLKRLQLDYVDLVFCHRPDPLTPTETVVRAMTDLIRSGQTTAWGTSEWSAQQITEAYWLAHVHGLEPPQFEQPQVGGRGRGASRCGFDCDLIVLTRRRAGSLLPRQYHMFERRRVEAEYAPLYQPPLQHWHDGMVAAGLGPADGKVQ